jgi:hypothetical protein
VLKLHENQDSMLQHPMFVKLNKLNAKKTKQMKV